MWFYDIREVYQSCAGILGNTFICYFSFSKRTHICSFLHKLIAKRDAAAKSAQDTKKFSSEHFSSHRPNIFQLLVPY